MRYGARRFVVRYGDSDQNFLAWTKWGRPSRRFSRTRSESNAQLLIDSFGIDWIKQGAIGHPSHTLLRFWRWANYTGYIELNELAEDIREVFGAPGLDSLLLELKHADKYEASRHTLQCAAAFVLGGNTIKEIFVPKNETVPDFLIVTPKGKQFVVEAKRLIASRDDVDFSKFANYVKQSLHDTFPSNDYKDLAITVAFKYFNKLPDIEDFRLFISNLPNNKDIYEDFEIRTELFNIFFSRIYLSDAINYIGYRIICAQSSRDTRRFEKRLKKANSQLKYYKQKNGIDGILCLGVGHDERIGEISSSVIKKFSAGLFTNTKLFFIVSRFHDHRDAVMAYTAIINGNTNEQVTLSDAPLMAYRVRNVQISPTYNANLPNIYETQYIEFEGPPVSREQLLGPGSQHRVRFPIPLPDDVLL